VIFVTVGTNETRFDRLLRWVEGLDADELVVQYGHSTFRPRNATCFDFVSFQELVEYVREASVVVTHAGVGSVAIAIANGKRPVVVPRLRRYGEHIDDHQLALGRRLAQSGLVTLVEDLDTVGTLPLDSYTSLRPKQVNTALAKDLSDCIHRLIQRGEAFPERRHTATVKDRGRGFWLRQK
jgi:beta-1,4-N-acetylglucosaminyltransferase